MFKESILRDKIAIDDVQIQCNGLNGLDRFPSAYCFRVLVDHLRQGETALRPDA
jgi:hypothetical protein